MSHMLDINADGTANLVLNRLPGWHGLGTVWQPGDAERLDLSLAMRHGNLADWNVRALPVWADDANGDAIDGESFRMTVRNHPTDADAPAQPLGIVTDAYVPVQNEEAFAFGEALLDAGLEVEAAGSLRGGRQTFILYRVPDTITIGTDTVVPYLHVSTSHDGSLAVTTKATGVRVLCGNTQRMSMLDGNPMYKARHVGEGLTGKIADAREALGIAHQTFDTFGQEMDRWLNTPATDDEFQRIIEVNFPKPKDDADGALLTRWETKVQDIRGIYASDTTANIAGTAWGVAQALMEWDEWVRGTDAGRAARAVSTDAEAQRGKFLRSTARVLSLA